MTKNFVIRVDSGREVGFGHGMRCLTIANEIKKKEFNVLIIMNRERNIWGKGQSAGHEVNTKYQEGSVYLHPDGKTMYFSSQGHNSMGGYDIFVSYIDELGHWGPAENLGSPINTPYDDLFYSSTASGKVAYIASNRKGGKGGLDIYKVTYWGSEKPQSLDSEEQLIASIANPIKDKSIAQPIVVEERNLTVFKGKVLDIITKQAVAANITITDNSTRKEYIQLNSNSSSGKFLISLPSGKNSNRYCFFPSDSAVCLPTSP